MLIIKNITKNRIVANDAKVANDFFTRLKGLLGTRKLEEGKGLIIQPCSSIHTVGMKYAIDVLFIDKNDQILKIVMDMPAGKFSICRNSNYVVELPAGVIASTGTALGDKLALLGKTKKAERL